MQGLELKATVSIAGLLGNTVQSLFHGDNNPFANISIVEPETDDDDGGILNNLKDLKSVMGGVDLSSLSGRKRGTEMTIADIMARL